MLSAAFPGFEGKSLQLILQNSTLACTKIQTYTVRTCYIKMC